MVAKATHGLMFTESEFIPSSYLFSYYEHNLTNPHYPAYFTGKVSRLI